jgi:hypothetical protein
MCSIPYVQFLRQTEELTGIHVRRVPALQRRTDAQIYTYSLYLLYSVWKSLPGVAYPCKPFGGLIKTLYV